MLEKKIILLLCLLNVSYCFARSSHPSNIKHDYLAVSRRQPFDRERSVTTTPRPIFQQYWQSFVSNLPTLPSISWNITNPIGNLFNGNAEQFIETPTFMSIVEEPSKRKTKVSKPKPPSINYYTTYDNNYQHIQLQPLGLDRNGIMHFYEPSSGQYYAMQVESQADYYKNQQYEYLYNPYGYYYNQYNHYGGYYDENNSASGEDQYYYQNNRYNSEYGHNSAEAYDYNQHYYSQNSEYDSEFSDHNKEPNHEDDNMDYDDSVQLADNWGYNDDEIFADRKLKKGSNKLDTLAERIIKIQKQLLKPETEEDAKLLLSEHPIDIYKNENMPTKDKIVENDGGSTRNAMGKVMKDDVQRKKQVIQARDNQRLQKNPRKQVRYYIFPTKLWL